MLEFENLANPALVPGIVLRTQGSDRFLRVTHVFGTSVYAMWVSTPERARYARRPFRMTLTEIQELASLAGSAWGRLPLPAIQSETLPSGSEKEQYLEVAWSLLQPLIDAFDKESNLSRNRFASLISARADATDSHVNTLRRMLLRYYYFGRTRLALLPLAPGLKPGQAQYGSKDARELRQGARVWKRRGRQPALAKMMGRNDFIVEEDDIADMVACLKRQLRQQATFISAAHESYLAVEFRRRHPTLYSQYIEKKCVEPVTARQYRYYTNLHANLSQDLAKNLRLKERNRGYLGSLRATGPGEVYEIDSTGGRLFLVSNDDPPEQLGTPTIYLIVDRWSRYVVSVYLSLKKPSYEEVRYALLIAFTSREKRFRFLNVDIDDVRWPVGQMPAELCPDRGSDFMSASMEQAVVQDLRMDLTPLPPYTPDAKAIVERFIREVKRRMASLGIKGVFADKPSDPDTKRSRRKAAAAAVHTEAEAYRILIEIVDDHNNRPHPALRRRRILAQAGVKPTPKEAYLWGLKYVTGLRRPPLTDDDYYRMLLSVDHASIGNGVLRYRGRAYSTGNQQASELCRHSSRRARQVSVRLDKTAPYELYVPQAGAPWAHFTLSRGGISELAGLTLDEEDALASRTAELAATAEHEARVGRVVARARRSKGHKPPARASVSVDRKRQSEGRDRETAALKQRLRGDPTTTSVDQMSESSTSTSDWKKIEEEDRQQILRVIREKRRMK